MKKLMTVMTVVLALGIAQVSNAQQWELDKAHTQVKFEVRHLLTDVTGKFKDFEVDFTFNEDDPTESSFTTTVQVPSIDTEVERRDNHLRSEDFFHVEQYPTMTYKSKSIERISEQQYKVIGDLTIKDTTREVELLVDIPTDPINFMGTEKIAVHMEGVINRTDYGLTWNKIAETGQLLVGEEVTMIVDAELNKAAEEEK